MEDWQHNRRGLMNPIGENNCFLNCTIQVLWHLDSFRNNFSLLEAHICTGEASCIFCALKILFAQYAHTDHAALPPDALRQALAQSFSSEGRFQVGLLDDAAECYENVLERIHFHVSRSAMESKLDPCRQQHCITHTKLCMSISERLVCSGCDGRRYRHQAPTLSFTQPIYYISTSALEQVSSMTSRCGSGLARPPLHQRNGSFACRLRAAMNIEDGPPCKDCGHRTATHRCLANLPEVLGIGLIWDSDQSSPEQINHLVNGIDQTIIPTELFDSISSNTGPGVTYQLSGLVCYYGKHYSTFLKQQQQQQHQQRQLRQPMWQPLQQDQWISCDDTCITLLGSSWDVVVDKICRGRYQPLLLLYTIQGLGTNPIRTQTAPQKHIFINQSEESFNRRPTSARRPMTSRSTKSSGNSGFIPSGNTNGRNSYQHHYTADLNAESCDISTEEGKFKGDATLPRTRRLCSYTSPHSVTDSAPIRRCTENFVSDMNLNCTERFIESAKIHSDGTNASSRNCELTVIKSEQLANSVSSRPIQRNQISERISYNSADTERTSNGVTCGSRQPRNSSNSLSNWIGEDGHSPPGNSTSSYINPLMVEKILKSQSLRPQCRASIDQRSDSSGSITGSNFSIDSLAQGNCSSQAITKTDKGLAEEIVKHSSVKSSKDECNQNCSELLNRQQSEMQNDKPNQLGILSIRQMQNGIPSHAIVQNNLLPSQPAVVMEGRKRNPPPPPPVRRTSALSTQATSGIEGRSTESAPSTATTEAEAVVDSFNSDMATSAIHASLELDGVSSGEVNDGIVVLEMNNITDETFIEETKRKLYNNRNANKTVNSDNASGSAPASVPVGVQLSSLRDANPSPETSGILKGAAGDRSSSSSTSSSIGSCSLSSNQDSGYRGSDAGDSTCDRSSVGSVDRIFVDFPGVGRVPIAAGYGSAIAGYSGEMVDWEKGKFALSGKSELTEKQLQWTASRSLSSADATCAQLLRDAEELLESSRAADVTQLRNKAMNLLKRAESVYGISKEILEEVKFKQESLLSLVKYSQQQEIVTFSECQEKLLSKEEIGEMIASRGSTNSIRNLIHCNQSNNLNNNVKADFSGVNSVKTPNSFSEVNDTSQEQDTTQFIPSRRSENKAGSSTGNNISSVVGVNRSKSSYEELLKKQVQAFVEKDQSNCSNLENSHAAVKSKTGNKVTERQQLFRNFDSCQSIRSISASRVSNIELELDEPDLIHSSDRKSLVESSYSISEAVSARKIDPVVKHSHSCDIPLSRNLEPVSYVPGADTQQQQIKKLLRPAGVVSNGKKKSVRFSDEVKSALCVDTVSESAELILSARRNLKPISQESISKERLAFVDQLSDRSSNGSLKSAENSISNSVQQSGASSIDEPNEKDFQCEGITASTKKKANQMSNVQKLYHTEIISDSTKNKLNKVLDRENFHPSETTITSTKFNLNKVEDINNKSNENDTDNCDSDFTEDDVDGACCSDDDDSEGTLIDECSSGIPLCSLCHKKRVIQSELYCSGCSFYMSRFQSAG